MKATTRIALETATARTISRKSRAADVAPPLLVEPEGGEDDDLADDDEADRLREQRPRSGAAAPPVVEEAQPEGEVEGERDESRVGHHLEDPVAIDGVVQPVA